MSRSTPIQDVVAAPGREGGTGGQAPGATPKARVDVIIVNYNSTDYLITCLHSVQRALGDVTATIYVEDNDSRDNVERIRRLFPQVVLTRNPRNLGFAAAVNRALQRSSAPVVVLLNPDSVVLSGLFELSLDYLEAHPDVAIVGPRILDGDGAVQGSARSFPTFLTGFFGRKSLISRLFPNNRITSANVLTARSDGIHPMEVDWVSGACMVIRRAAIEAVGAFDERFFMYWEDADWCRRMWQRGWKVVYLPQPTVVHFVGVSSDQLMLRSTFAFHKSSFLLFDKYNRRLPWLVRPLILCGLLVRFSLVMLSAELYQCYRRLHRRRLPAATMLPAARRIKVLRMIARLNIGGPAIHVHLLTQGLNNGRFESKLVAGSISPQEGDMSYLFASDANQPIILPELQRDISLRMDLRALLRIFRILERERPDIVHTHTAKAGFSARFAVLVYNLIFGRRVHIVHTFHGHVFEGYFSRFKSWMFVMIERLMAAFTDVIIAISQSQKDEITYKYAIAPSTKVKAVELGFDLNPFLGCGPLKGRFRREIGVDSQTVLIGIIGRLVPIKNHRMFLEAVRLFLAKERQRKVTFLVLGDGELRAPLEAYCRRHSLEGRVRFYGWRRNVHEVYADLDVLALTSLNEGTPVSIIEAMAASVPVIATDAGGVLDLLGPVNGYGRHEGYRICERGILCRKGDADGFADGLLHLVRANAAETRARVQRARGFVEKRYAKERLLNDIEDLYLDLISASNQRQAARCASSSRPLLLAP